MNASMTQQIQDVCFVEIGIGSESSRFGEGSPTVHNRIAGSIQGSPWIGSGSTRGAKREHPWIVRLRKIVKDQSRYRCKRSYDVDESHSFMEVAIGQSKLNNHIERSGVDPLTPCPGLGEPDSAHGDVYFDPFASEPIRFEC